MTRELTEFFAQSRYRTTRNLLCFTGLWPYQEKIKKYIINVMTVFVSASAFPAQISVITVHKGDWGMFIATMGPILIHSVIVIKVAFFTWYSEKVCRLLERMYDDWHAPMGNEKQVLVRYADDGRLYVFQYSAEGSDFQSFLVLLYFAMIVSVFASVSPRILNLDGWSNVSAPSLLFVLPVHFTSDDEKNYVYVQSYVIFGVIMVISISIAVDGIFITLVQHGCGIFSAVGYRLKHLVDGEEMNVELYPHISTDKTFWIVVDCIKQHREAVKYAVLLESAYAWPLLFVISLNMLSISFTGIQLILGASPDSLDQIIRQTVLAGSQVVHLFLDSFFCQQLTNHHFEIFQAIGRSMWYKTSMRTRRLLNFMLMKSSIPWELKAGKIYAMTMENYGAIVRTSMSYLTILSSMA